MLTCNVCYTSIEKPVYVSSKPVSITSLCEIANIQTIVYYCEHCGHLQTSSMGNIDEFYNKEYKILINSDEEDQLYDIINNVKIFRTEHQVKTLINKVDIPLNAKVLDYGCAKGASLKGLIKERADINPFLFDVSDMYIPFWQKFAIEGNWSIYNPNEDWNEEMDLITSFFALEHVEDPKLMLEKVRRLLKVEGIFYCIIPNVYKNIADFVVVDHINHFSINSLNYLFNNSGFELLEIDEVSHQNAYIIIAKKREEKIVSEFQVNKDLKNTVSNMAKYWETYAQKVKHFEEDHANQKSAIYGSGFYGTFIYTCLSDTSKVCSFLDQNPYLQGKHIFDKPVIAPSNIDPLIENIYVGLNPIKASAIINEISIWKESRHHYFFPPKELVGG